MAAKTRAGSRRKRSKTTAASTSTKKEQRSFDKITKDPLDLRDRMYEPSLEELPFEVTDFDKRVPMILDQGKEGACTGFGLAAVVNYLLHNRQDTPAPKISVSPRMLYEMAKRYDEWEGENYEGSSIRGAMKGWNRHGVCDETHWPYRGGAKRLSPEGQIDALNRPLGAYYRVRHLHLNHMHAALNDTGILYASASVHEGWFHVDKKTGKIPYRSTKAGGHAFAIVGYDREGFWIQNSWGPSWGCDGYCHISYDDWIENGWDCWVARMGVPTLGLGGAAEAGRSRAQTFDYIPHDAVVMADIQPHFVNLGNDGRLSQQGRYSSDEDDVRAIFRERIPQTTAGWNGTPRLLLYAHGGLNDEKASASRIATMKPIFLANEIYPLHFMWETGLKETVSSILQDAFRRKRFSGWRDGMRDRFYDLLDEGVELAARPLGRPLWAQMKDNAQKARASKGGARMVAKEIQRYQKEVGPLEIHLVGHSAGSIFHGHLVPYLVGLGVRIKTLTLYAPACSTKLFRDNVLPSFATSVSGGQANRAIERITIFNLDDDAERDDTVGSVYHKSLLYLVSESFETSKGLPLLGMDRFLASDAEGIHTKLGARQESSGSTVIYSKGGADVKLESASTSHGGFDNDEKTLNSTLRILLAAKTPRRRFPTTATG
ncbi:MAG: C1 family peptidase [Betaproteobacteria bacterium]|nr:C1 family peptidase [Gammaproteobacteria bacterium]MDH3435999.1 C1 family peptidase [Betaproteobacteria bacterium]